MTKLDSYIPKLLYICNYSYVFADGIAIFNQVYHFYTFVQVKNGGLKKFHQNCAQFRTIIEYYREKTWGRELSFEIEYE